MNVYIAFDRYEHDEWYSVYYIDKNQERAIQHCKEIDLVDFISYGPDDCHSFQLMKVIMTPDEYHLLQELVEAPNESKKLEAILYDIFYETGRYEVETLLQTDGCSDAYELVKFFMNRPEFVCDLEDEDEREYDAQEQLSNNEELFQKMLKEYIDAYY